MIKNSTVKVQHLTTRAHENINNIFRNYKKNNVISLQNIFQKLFETQCKLTMGMFSYSQVDVVSVNVTT